MKTIRKTLMCTTLGLVLLTGCRKYEEGPFLASGQKKKE